MLDNHRSLGFICPRFHAISLLLANDPQLLRLLFRPGTDTLCASVDEITDWTAGYSTGQKVLIQVALDIWSGEGLARLSDIISLLDPVRFEGFMLALESLRYGSHKN